MVIIIVIFGLLVGHSHTAILAAARFS